MPAAVGEVEPAGGALDERNAEMRLELREATAHGGFGKVQPLGGSCDAAGLDDADEDLHPGNRPLFLNQE